jgi:hypothetical protein
VEEIIYNIVNAVILSFFGLFSKHWLRERQKAVLRNRLTKDGKKWRTFPALCRSIRSDGETTRELLIELGAKASTKPKDVWTLDESRIKTRRERRKAQREKEKLKKRNDKQLANLSLAQRIAKGALDRLWALIVAIATVIGLYVIFRPHVSIEPQIVLNPVDPYTTQFNLKNENPMFSIYNVDAVCWPRNMESGNGFSVISPGPLVNVHHEIPFLESGASSTVDCPPVIGGIGRWSGPVVNAELEFVVSYRQSWWPFLRHERHAFDSRRDVQGAVHWVHITPYEEKSLAEIFNKH